MQLLTIISAVSTLQIIRVSFWITYDKIEYLCEGNSTVDTLCQGIMHVQNCKYHGLPRREIRDYVAILLSDIDVR